MTKALKAAGVIVFVLWATFVALQAYLARVYALEACELALETTYKLGVPPDGAKERSVPDSTKDGRVYVGCGYPNRSGVPNWLIAK